LLAVIIVTGYRKVFRGWRRDVTTGSLPLAFFFVGLVYNFTEAAFFKMLAPAWWFFLFAIVSVPAVSLRKKAVDAELVTTSWPGVKGAGLVNVNEQTA
jgi:hypothetical protein